MWCRWQLNDQTKYLTLQGKNLNIFKPADILYLAHILFSFKKCDLNINKNVILKVLGVCVNSLLSFVHLETFIYATCLISADILEHWHFQCMFLEFGWTDRQKEIVGNSSRKAIYSIINTMYTGILKQLWNSWSPCLHLILCPKTSVHLQPPEINDLLKIIQAISGRLWLKLKLLSTLLLRKSS